MQSDRGTRTKSAIAKPGPARTPWWFSLVLALKATILQSSLAADHPELSPQARGQIQILQAEKAARPPALRKLDSQLQHALRQRRLGTVAPGLNAFRPELRFDADDRVLVDLRAQVTPALLQYIERNGGQVINSFGRYHAIRARATLALIEQLAARPEVRALRPADEAITNTGSVTSGGDAAHRADQVRGTYAVDGAGLRIGVLSDSVDHLALSQAAGELPPVTILPGQPGTGSGEGTAMLEIIHDLAPGADLYFATAFSGVASFAQNIRDLHAAGCRIIVDDVIYFSESPLQDGPISQAVNDVSAAGTLFFSSAGNGGSKLKGTSGTWEGDFKDGGAATLGGGGRLHDFGGLTYNTVLPGGGFTRLDLFWADPLGASTNDYDVYVLNSADQVVRSSTNVQDGDDDPYESLSFLAAGERVVIVKSSGENRFLSLMTLRGRLALATPGSVRGHNASGATNAFSVAAARVSSPPLPFDTASHVEVEPFSSDGPRRIFFHPDGSAITPGDYSATGGLLLEKPDITAADGVATSVPGFANFLGTSAAAPHAGAIAALLWDHKPLLSASEVRAYLAAPALDIEGAGPDRNAGAGIVMADQTFAPQPRLVLGGVQVADANGSGGLDASECADLTITLENLGLPTTEVVTGITAVLSSSTPGVTVDPLPRTFPDLAPGSNGTNLAPFRISTARLFHCGTNAHFVLQVGSSNGLSFSLPFLIQPSVPPSGPVVSAVSTTVMSIPDLGVAESQLLVTNLNQLLDRVRVGVHLTHTFDYDLRLSLVSPEGLEVFLSMANGGAGQDYGLKCDSMTLFSDDAVTNITQGAAPFIGNFRPQQPLAVFHGRSGGAVNGVWTLRVRDEAALDSGLLRCWSLELFPLACADGGGECLVAPKIVQGPVSQVATEGETVQFTVQAVGTLPLAYQWSFAHVTNAVANHLAVGTNATITLSNVSLANVGSYWVLVSNHLGQQLSQPASLTVQSLPLILCGTNRAVQLGAAWDFDAPITSGEEVTLNVLSTTTNAGCGDGYSATRTWMASDTNGFQAACSQIITVLDTRPPTIACAPDFTVPFGANWGFDVPVAAAAGAVAERVYDNSLNDLLYRFDPGPTEVGDEIILAGPARQITRFAFEFWGQGADAAGFTGDVLARLRFYKNDGPLSPSGYTTPGNVFFDSGPFPIPATPRSVAIFEDFQVEAAVPLTVPLPDSFTWTVQFSGLAEGDSAGLDIYSPPVVGNNYTDYWERENGTWVQKTNLVSMDFAARLEASDRGVTLALLTTVTNAPMARADSYSVTQGDVLNVNAPGVLANDQAANGNPMTAALESGALHGDLSLNGDGSFLYVPGAGFSGADSFTYRALSGVAVSASAMVNLSVLAADTMPPTITKVTAINANSVRVQFSEPVAAVGAETPDNYSINNGVTISNAVLGADARTVVLSTSALSAADYLLSAVNVTDRATPPNSISASPPVPFGVAGPRVSSGLVVLYGFGEGAGTIVHDVSGVGAPLDLDILDPTAVQWLRSVTGGVRGIQFTREGSAIRSAGAATKIHAALTNRNRLTLEAWLTPANLSQEGPTRIVTVSEGTTVADMNLHLGQDLTNASFRLRTSVNSFSWLPAENVFTNLDLPCHIVATYDGELKRLYVDGVEHRDEFLLGDFSNWNAAYPLVLGNEASLDRSWLGSLHLVAIYDRALAWAEVQQNQLAGPMLVSPATNTAPVAVADDYSVTSGATLQVDAPGVLGNDADAEGDGLTAVLESGVLHGRLMLNWDGSFVYTPDSQFSGADSFSYRALDGLTNSTLTVVSLNVNPGSETPPGNTTVITRTWQATDECGNSAVCSQSVTVVDSRPPLIVGEPQSDTVTAGENAVFTVMATGALPLSYQWFFHQTNVLDQATDAALELTNVQASDAGGYSVVVSNVFGAVTSTVVTLTVWLPPFLTQQPASLALTNGQTALFSVMATGTEPLAYQWFFNNRLVPGATTSVLTLAAVQASDAGHYVAVVTNASGAVTSQVASLFVGVPAVICSADRTVAFGVPWDFDAPEVFEDATSVDVLDTITNAICGDGMDATRTWLVRDTNGLQATCVQTISVQDTRPPTLVCAPDKTVPFGADWTFDAPVGRAAGAAVSVVYDNSVSDLSQRFDPGTAEVGDEITLGGLARHAGKFAFGFWGSGTNAGEFSGQVAARLRFYQNDGPLSADGDASPGTVLFDSGPFPIPAAPRAIVRFEDFQIDAVVPLAATLPESFTWTVQFSGHAAGDNAGFDLFSPPAIGDNSASYWRRENGDWVSLTNAAPMNFAAKLEALSRGVAMSEVGTVTNGPVGNTMAFTRSWRATDDCGNSATCSQTVTVVDTQPPLIVESPQSQTVNSGETVSFTVSATGAAPLSYQWLFNETNSVAGAIGSSLALTDVQATNNGSYSVMVSNAYGAVTSAAASLTVFSAPWIVSQPANQNVSPGDSTSFGVVVAGHPPPVYQWIFNETNLLADATSSVLVIANAQSEQAGLYSVAVTNSLGAVTSQVARLTFGVPAFVAVPPQPVTALLGQNAAFTVGPGGTPPFSFQWYFNCASPLAAATSATLVLTNISLADSGSYCVLVSNAHGSAFSAPAVLRVLSSPDIFFITRTGTVVTVTFSTVTNQFYTVQFMDAINATEWSVLRKGSNRPGTGFPMVLQDLQASGSQRFYRILIE